MKKVRIINTGGTISMKRTPHGMQPQPGLLADQMDELSQAPMPAYDILELDPLIDSSNVSPEVWGQIAEDIHRHYETYDGFVILHGTDTMAYTASALPLMLPGLNKPVILTGAQLPLGQLRSDARENLKTAMVLAANYDIPEVALFFDDQLLRGCRSTKVSATRFDAFASPNYPPLAVAGTKLDVFYDRILPSTDAVGLQPVKTIQSNNVASFRLFPGLSVDLLNHFLRHPLKALILETYGDGNGPTHDPDFLKAIHDATNAGIVVVGCSQCLHGGSTLSNYATGTALEAAGVISAKDMTIEALFAKLLFLFSHDLSPDEVKQKVSENLIGELTVN